MSLAGFEPTISASERTQTHALDRATTGIGPQKLVVTEIIKTFLTFYVTRRFILCVYKSALIMPVLSQMRAVGPTGNV
jgi:hypothetical protein